MNWYKKIFDKQNLYDYLRDNGYSNEEAKRICNKMRDEDYIAETKEGEWSYLNQDKYPLALHEKDPEHAVGVGSIKHFNRKMRIKKLSQMYNEIGHSGVGSGNDNILWISNADGSEFEIEEGSFISGHEEMVEENELENKFRGRFDPNSNEVSILAPIDWYHNIPNSLIRRLYKEFGDNIKISIFDAFGNYAGRSL